ncbi:DUF499 domain-containing protein [Rhodococcus opacus]|uniref:DUF499 domain-containing protein n=1 Tax=Rhodococcus opacus TaxID=37919 RepID=A0AAX3YR28_RHOOP|nr:DUF499 domain-containing protein [Rhodococcus opacus]WLF51536.1 DUF499 domain-containing protein [Rhodococcus opacus]
MATSVTPWWKALQIRKEIINASGQIDDVQMSLFQAVYGRGANRAPYADATYYGSITHPTERLIDLLAEIAIRIGGGSDYQKARAVTRLDQGMGGGKSHACIGAFHLAANPSALMLTELGQAVAAAGASKIGRPLAGDLDNPHVVVLPCDSMTPFAPVQELDGPATTLYERFLWRLFSKDYSLFERYQPYWSDKSKIAEAIRAVNRPVLVIVDEILDYIGNGLDGAQKPDLGAQDVAFLRALLDVINDVPNVAMVVVMIASDKDSIALSAAAQARRDDLNSLLDRNGTPATVTEVGDFADILRRRLFESDPAKEVLAATAELYRSALADKAWVKNVWDATSADWRREWDAQVAACYPFHPMLIGIAKNEWSMVTGFQRVRSTIRIFAATVYAQQQRGLAGEWVPALIGPGDLPLSDNSVREALLGSGLVEDERTIANYRSLAENEVVNAARDGGIARKQDLGRGPLMWAESNPFASERAATFIFLASIVGTLRPGRGRGASAPEVKAATSIPDALYTVTDADLVVEDLVNPDGGMSAVESIPGQGNNKPARYFLSTRLTHRMLVNNIKRTITETERDEVIAKFADRLASTGPFRDLKFVSADRTRTAVEVLTTAGVDTAHVNRLVVLDPAQFSLRNGMEQETMEALTTAMGLNRGTAQVPVQWASSAVYAVVNTQRRGVARGVAVEYLARQKALAAPEVQGDAELKATGSKDFSAAKDQLEKAVRRAYQHLVFLAQPDPDGERTVEDITFDSDNLTALDGTMAWKALAERDKAFDAGQFSAKALTHNLRDQDYGRSLSEIRSAFYNAPRLPLLYGGDSDLQHAIFDAVHAGLMRIVDGSDTSVAVTGPGQVNLASTGLRLAKPLAKCDVCGVSEDNHNCTLPTETNVEHPVPASPTSKKSSRSGTFPSPDVPVEKVHSAETEIAPTEKQLAFSFTSNLLNQENAADGFAAMFRSLYLACDERQVSYLQGTLQLVVDGDAAADIADKAAELGFTVTARDM